MIERIWSEVNNRFNYPIKAVLSRMENMDEIDMADETTKFCTSQLGVALANIGMSRIIDAWNVHPIPSKLKVTLSKFISQIMLSNLEKNIDIKIVFN